jgi:NAD-dependent SIR2 family protein deacetylase
MTLERFYCGGCGIVFYTDLELSEEHAELRHCPTCGTLGTLRPDNVKFELCACCADTVRAADTDDRDRDTAEFIQ